MAKTKYPRNPVKVQAPPGAGSYKLKKGEYQRQDKPQGGPVAISDRKAKAKAEAEQSTGEAEEKAKADKPGGNAGPKNNVRSLDKGKQE